MNVAADSDVGSAGQPLGIASGLASASFSRSSAPGLESFHTGLQTLLARLGSGPGAAIDTPGGKQLTLGGTAEEPAHPAENPSSEPAGKLALAVGSSKLVTGRQLASSGSASNRSGSAGRSLISAQAVMLSSARQTQANLSEKNLSSIVSATARNAATCDTTAGPGDSRSTKTSKRQDAGSAAELSGAAIDPAAAIAHAEPAIPNPVQAPPTALSFAPASDSSKSDGKTGFAAGSLWSLSPGSALDLSTGNAATGSKLASTSASARSSSAKNVQAGSGRITPLPSAVSPVQRQGPSTASARAGSIPGEQRSLSSLETASRGSSPGDDLAAANSVDSAAPGAATAPSDTGGISNNQDVLLTAAPLPQGADATAGAKAAGEAGKTLSAGGVRTRTGPGWSAREAVQGVGHAAEVQSAVLPADAALVRDISGPHAAAGSGLEPAGSPGASAASAGDTFAALDAKSGPGTLSWTHAWARSAEAGYEDPTFGWVGVRADLSGGAVHAAVLPSSAEAAQALGGHMSGLNSYLAGQHSAVDTVTIAGPHSSEAGMGSLMDQGNAQNTGQGSSSGQDSGPRTSSPEAAKAESRPAAASDGSREPALPARPVGSLISVMA